MPHKFNAARRHKFPKKRYRVTNWAEYTETLRRRGDLTIWVTDDTLKQWRAPRRTTPGGQPKYSNIAIETCLTLRTIYKLPLRQTQGLMRSIARLMGVELVEGPGRNMVRRRGESAEQIARLPRAEIVKRRARRSVRRHGFRRMAALQVRCQFGDGLVPGQQSSPRCCLGPRAVEATAHGQDADVSRVNVPPDNAISQSVITLPRTDR